MKKFPCTLDKRSILITCAVIALSIAIFILCYHAYEQSEHDTGFLLMALIAPAALLIIVIGMYYLRPESITVNESTLAIDRKVKPVTIRLSDIKSIYALSAEAMHNTIRTLGDGGLFGYTGYYYNRKQGTMLLYCTQRTNYIVIETTADKKIVISPDTPNELLQYVQTIQPSIVKARVSTPRLLSFTSNKSTFLQLYPFLYDSIRACIDNQGINTRSHVSYI